MTVPQRIAVVVPGYQAAPSIGDVIRRTKLIIDDVWAVDDGSDDDTAKAAAEAGATVLVHPQNMGKGTALRTAFNEIFPLGYDAVITIDADGQHLPEEIPKLLAGAADGADLVLGTRESLFTLMSPLRRTSNRISSWAISCVAGRRLLDVAPGG